MEAELLALGVPLLAGATWVLDRAERLRSDVARALGGAVRDVRELREGLVGVEGTVAVLEGVLDDAVTGQPVVYFHWRVQRAEPSGRVELAARSDRVPFRLVAAGGEVLIEPYRAQVRAPEGELTIPIEVASRLAPVGRTDGPTLQAVGATIPIGAPVYVLGVAERLTARGGPFRGAPERWRIRAVRGLPFVVSTQPQEELLRLCRRTAHRALVVGGGAFLGAAALLAAGLG